MKAIETKQKLQKEIIIAILGIMMLTSVFIFEPGMLDNSSPLALLIIAVAGLLLAVKFKLPGGIFLFFAGLALVVHPLMFSSSLWLVPGGALTGFAGLLILVNWWKQDN